MSKSKFGAIGRYHPWFQISSFLLEWRGFCFGEIAD